MSDRDRDDHRQLPASEGVDGPTPPRPEPAISTEWPDGEDVVALRMSWTIPDRRAGRRRLEIWASIDGRHDATLRPCESTDTILVGVPAGRQERMAPEGARVRSVSHHRSRSYIERLVTKLRDGGFLVNGVTIGQRELEQDERDDSQAAPLDWRITLFYGSTPVADRPIARRATRFILGPQRTDRASLTLIATTVHGALWAISERETPDVGEAESQVSPASVRIQAALAALNKAGAERNWDRGNKILASLDRVSTPVLAAVPFGDAQSLLGYAQTVLHEHRDQAELAIEVFRRGWPSVAGDQALLWFRSVRSRGEQSPPAPESDSAARQNEDAIGGVRPDRVPEPAAEAGIAAEASSPVAEDDFIPIDPNGAGDDIFGTPHSDAIEANTGGDAQPPTRVDLKVDDGDEPEVSEVTGPPTYHDPTVVERVREFVLSDSTGYGAIMGFLSVGFAPGLGFTGDARLDVLFYVTFFVIAMHLIDRHQERKSRDADERNESQRRIAELERELDRRTGD